MTNRKLEKKLGSFEDPIVVNSFDELKNAEIHRWVNINGSVEVKGILAPENCCKTFLMDIPKKAIYKKIYTQEKFPLPESIKKIKKPSLFAFLEIDGYKCAEDLINYLKSKK